MGKEARLDYCNKIIGEVATELAQAYVQDGNFIGFYLGQISMPGMLSLFPPFSLESTIVMIHLLQRSNRELADQLRIETELATDETESCVKEHLDCYAENDSTVECFTIFCEQAATRDGQYMSTLTDDNPLQKTLNDRRFVAIQNAVHRLEQLASELGRID